MASTQLSLRVLVLGLWVTVCVGTYSRIISLPPDESAENIVIDKDSNLYVSIVSKAEILRFKVLSDGKYERSTITKLSLGVRGHPSCQGLAPATTGLTFDPKGRLFVSGVACNADANGIWRVDRTGKFPPKLVGKLPLGAFANGLDYYDDYLYGADSFSAKVYRLGPVSSETFSYEVWSESPLLRPPMPGPFSFGPNGLKVFRGTVYVANSAGGTILKIPIQKNGNAGTATVFSRLPVIDGFQLSVDDFTFDSTGQIYAALNSANSLGRISANGKTLTRLLVPRNGVLDRPTSAAFGGKGSDRKKLYITSAAFRNGPPAGPPQPGVTKLSVKFTGEPDAF